MKKFNFAPKQVVTYEMLMDKLMFILVLIIVSLFILAIIQAAPAMSQLESNVLSVIKSLHGISK